MQKKTLYRYTLPVLICTLLLLWSPPVFAVQTAIATLSKVTGKVEVRLAKNKKVTIGRNGLLLYPSDQIATGSNGRVTILFRDGSEIRLFENTQFVIESGHEVPTEKRSFRYKLFMKLGSVWGNFMRGRQKTNIRTPTATIGVKGTTLRISDTKEKGANVSLTEGLITVKNDTSEIELLPGKRIKNFSKRDQLSEKVEDIPSKLFMKTENYQLDFKSTAWQTVRISIQMGNVASGKYVKRPGNVYLRSDYYNVRFPSDVKLDSEGFIRIPVKIGPPRTKDKEFDGKVIIWAVMDEADMDDVGAGNLTLKVKTPGKRRHFQLDADSGDIIPGQ